MNYDNERYLDVYAIFTKTQQKQQITIEKNCFIVNVFKALLRQK